MKSKQSWDQVERTDCLKWRKFPEEWSRSEMQRRRVIGGGRGAAAGCLKGRREGGGRIVVLCGAREGRAAGWPWCAQRQGRVALYSSATFRGSAAVHCSAPNPARGGGRRLGAPGVVARSLSSSAPGEICGCRDTSPRIPGNPGTATADQQRDGRWEIAEEESGLDSRKSFSLISGRAAPGPRRSQGRRLSTPAMRRKY